MKKMMKVFGTVVLGALACVTAFGGNDRGGGGANYDYNKQGKALTANQRKQLNSAVDSYVTARNAGNKKKAQAANAKIKRITGRTARSYVG